MSVGYDLGLLRQIACNAIAINAAAGGAAAYASTGDYYPTMLTIACNLGAANTALGNPAVGGDWSSINGLPAVIACQANAMAGVNFPFDPYSPLSVWNAIDCALGVVATNTGQGYSGWNNGSVYNLMQGAVCLTAQIVENGFGPPIPVILFHLSAGDRPTGNYFERFGPALSLSSTAADPYAAAPNWHMATGTVPGFLAALGDSITYGATVMESFVPKVWRASFGSRNFHVANLGVNAARLVNVDPAISIDAVATTYVTPVFGSMKGVFIVFGGSNCMFLDSLTPAQTFAHLQTVCQNLRASHPNAKIIVVTTLPRENNGGFEGVRQSFNTLVRGGDASYDYVADWGANATMAANAGDTLNTTYYTDTIHPTDAGHVIGQSIITPVVNTALAALGI